MSSRRSVDDGSLFGLFERLNETYRGTGGLQAMVALVFNKNGSAAFTRLLVDHGVGLGCRAPSILKNGEIGKGHFRRRQLVDRVAGAFAFTTADAPGDIVQNGHAVRITGELFVGGGPG